MLQKHAMGDHALYAAAIPALIVLACALFTVRGYHITPDEIIIERLAWNTALKRDGLVSATVDPSALKHSVRVCGNGGLFSFSGFYWNRQLRTFRAFVTDPKLCVVLVFPKRKIVVSPDYPVAFCHALSPSDSES